MGCFLRGAAWGWALWQAAHACLDLAGLPVRRLHHRCLCPAHCGWTGQPSDDDEHRARRAGTGAVRPPTWARRQSRASLRPGLAVCQFRYSERLAEAGSEPSMESNGGGSYGNTQAETINGLHKAELIYQRGPWKTREAVALATLKWVVWRNISSRPPLIEITKFALRFIRLRLTAAGGRLDDSRTPFPESQFVRVKCIAIPFSRSLSDPIGLYRVPCRSAMLRSSRRRPWQAVRHRQFALQILIN